MPQNLQVAVLHAFADVSNIFQQKDKCIHRTQVEGARTKFTYLGVSN